MKTFESYIKEVGEIGYVEQISQSLVIASGLPRVRAKELVLSETGELGQVLGVSEDEVEILLLSKNLMRVGTRLVRMNEFLQIPVGKELLGQTVDPLGYSLDHIKAIPQMPSLRPVDIQPSGILTRERVSQSLETGVTLVDMLVPLGKGQRELVIGDRKTGKTIFLLQTILTQARQGTICIYAAIGKKKLDIKKVEEFFIKNAILDMVCMVASTSQDPPGIIYISPYAAMTIAEYFRDQGKDVLLVLDDLLTHAKFYREISLLSKRFPGRNSYPGDIFYTHARLLERAGNFKSLTSSVQKNVAKNPPTGNAITCLPVVETAEGDIGGYIQTNLMSMTDGHIYFDNDLFSKGRRPAINPFLSVSRVGRQTQNQLKREISRELISFLTLFDKMQSFVQFGAELSETTQRTLKTGDRILTFFNQTSDKVILSPIQILLFCMLWIGIWDNKSNEVMKAQMEKIISAYLTNEAFQKQINLLVNKTNSFNSFLNLVRQESGKILVQVNIKQ